MSQEVFPIRGGWRGKGADAFPVPGLPSLSVVTVSFNAAHLLERTLRSVLGQTYPNVEHIVVDGGSSDGTVELLRRYDRRLAYWVSEPDGGIYPAMNKALELCRGDYVWFVNAGDTLHSPDTARLMFASQARADVYYGDTLEVDAQGRPVGHRRHRPPERLGWRDFRRGMLVSHQSFVARRALARPYDTAYRCSADYKWALEILGRANKVANTGLVLSDFLTGGFTRQNLRQGLVERFEIMSRRFGLGPTVASHLALAARLGAFYLRNGRF